MSETIAIGLAPNNFKEDIFLALKAMLNPFAWRNGEAVGKIEDRFKDLFNVPYAFSFNSGRSALQTGLQALGLPLKSEVLTQAFSCVVVANSIRFAGLKPIFTDVAKNSFGPDIKDLERKITPRTKAIILQNIFGIPDDLNKIQALAKKYNLIMIEDCAQALGAEYWGKKIGQFGRLAFFSFGRDKVISSTFGGILITKDKKLASNINQIYREITFPNFFWIFKQLLHPLAFSLIAPSYFNFQMGKFSLGKAILFLLQKSCLIDPPVKESEKQGSRLKDCPKRLPNALAVLALNQLKRLNQFNRKRLKIAQYYTEEALKIKNIHLFKFNKNMNKNRKIKPIFLRFPLVVEDRNDLLAFAKKRKIILGNWYDNVIAPKKTALNKIGYKKGSCPQAEELANKIINLPTYPKMVIKDAKRVIHCLKSFYAAKSIARGRTTANETLADVGHVQAKKLCQS